MKTRTKLATALLLATALPPTALILAQQAGAGRGGAMARPEGPCDVYAGGNTPCVAAHSTTRALFAAYNGPLYQIERQSDGKKLDIGVVQASATDAGGYADAAAQDDFCASTYCWIATVYDQSGHKNDLAQAPRGGTGSPTALGGFDAVPVADMAPVTVLGHKVYGIYIEPGMGLRDDNPHGTAVDDQAEGQYWVVDGHHFNGGCCFDYGNAETDSRDDDAGTMETAYFGNANNWYHGPTPGPWIMTDQENNLVGCVTQDGTKNCDLPIITWPFVTATADGEPHHWRSMGGDAQTGELKVMFDGPRVDRQYDPMRKQGAIDMGNGGDNSNGSDGTIYEAAMTAAGTFPTQETLQKVQANVVAAHYAGPQVSIAPASAAATPPGLQTFSPGSAQDTSVSFTNTSGSPVSGVTLSLSIPTGWTAAISGGDGSTKTFSDPVAPGATVSAIFKLTAGPASYNGDLNGLASWKNSNGQSQSGTTHEKIRSESPVKINEFAISSNTPADATNSFIELYNASENPVDLSSWSLTEHASQQAIFSSVKIPSGTQLASKGFYVLGISNSGLAVPAKSGDATIYVRSVDGMNVGNSIQIDTGAGVETRKITNIGTAAGNSMTLWQPLPDGPIITIPAGSTSVPYAGGGGGFGGGGGPAVEVGQKIALGYGATYPAVDRDLEKYEVVTVTAVGKPGTQTRLAAAAHTGDTSIRVMNAGNISIGDTINLDIDSVGHGTETVTISAIDTQGGRGGGPGAAGPGGAAPAGPGAPAPTIAPATAPGAGADGAAPGGRGAGGFGRGGGRGRGGAGGATLELAAPLKFNHSSNLPFSVRGTGISFQPASAYPHSSNEPIVPLGTGITLDSPLNGDHDVNAVVRDAAVTDQGYQGTAAPNQWFGGPVLANAGAMILRDAAGLTVDSLNYGGLVDPWAGEGYQGKSPGSGCSVPSPAQGRGGFGRGGRGRGGRGGPGGPGAADGGAPAAPAPNRSAARTTDGADSDSNCADFKVQTPTPGAANGKRAVKVTAKVNCLRSGSKRGIM